MSTMSDCLKNGSELWVGCRNKCLEPNIIGIVRGLPSSRPMFVITAQEAEGYLIPCLKKIVTLAEKGECYSPFSENDAGLHVRWARSVEILRFSECGFTLSFTVQEVKADLIPALEEAVREVQERERKIREIEAYTPKDICEILISSGISKKSRSVPDYGQAKQIIFQGLPINDAIYMKHIQTISRFVGIG